MSGLDAFGYTAVVVAELRAAQASDPTTEDDNPFRPHRTRVPARIRQQLVEAPGGVVDVLATLIGLPHGHDEIVAAAIDLLGVLAPKQTLLDVWLRHGWRVRVGVAGAAFMSALRDRGEEGYWIVDELSAHAERELAEAKSPGLPPARMRELALTGNHPDTFRTIVDRDDLPVDLLVDLARSGLAVHIADHPRLPVEVLLELARGRDYRVTARSMENPGLPPDWFSEFVEHEAEIVRLAIAERARYDGDVPDDISARLASDRSEAVRAVIEAWRRDLDRN